jgi:hypothetical protein
MTAILDDFDLDIRIGNRPATTASRNANTGPTCIVVCDPVRTEETCLTEFTCGETGCR